MDRCHDHRKLSELDPVTFFIVTELMRAENIEPDEALNEIDYLERQVA